MGRGGEDRSPASACHVMNSHHVRMVIGPRAAFAALPVDHRCKRCDKAWVHLEGHDAFGRLRMEECPHEGDRRDAWQRGWYLAMRGYQRAKP